MTMTSVKTDVLVTPAWLEAHLDDPSVRVVEVDVSPAAYAGGHVSGAVLWNVYRDLKDADYRLVEAASVEAILSRSGIAPDSTIVLYGYAPTLGFWLMKLYGHADVRLLDCGRDSWRDGGRPWTVDMPQHAVTSYPLGATDDRIRASQAAVLAAIDDPGTTIVDVRTSVEFIGERFWPSGVPEENGRAGHVPTAVHAPLDGVYADDGSFRTPADIARILPSIDGDLITYCTIGNRAAVAWFAWTYLLGRDDVRVYDGSWAEWGRTPTAPVHRGVGTDR